MLGDKDERDGMKSHHTLWSYRDNRIDTIFSDEFKGSVWDLDIDSHNNIWIATSEGVYHCDGKTLEKSKDVVIPVASADIIDNPINDELLIASAKGYDQPSQLFYNANIYRYKNGKLDTLIPENSELISLQPGSLYVDNRGNLWVIYYNQNIAVSRFDGTKWTAFGPGTLLNGLRVNSIVSDTSNRLFFGIIRSTSSNNTLAMLDGDTWILNPLPVLKHDPRIWWRQEDLSELFKHPVVPVKIQEVLQNPIEYRGKKISFVGKIKSGFEYASLVDLDGKVLNIWPEYRDELSQALKDMGISSELEKSEYQEFIGYLEFGGRYGHMGGWSDNLFITEIYPYTTDDLQKAKYRMLYKNYVKAVSLDKQAIKTVIDQWVSAIKTGDVEGLKKVYHTGSVLYQSLLTQRGAEYAKTNIMDIAIRDMDIGIAGANASARINDATIKPERPGSSVPGGTGIFKLRSISLSKDNDRWKITEYSYTPDPPSMTIPRSTITPAPPPSR